MASLYKINSTTTAFSFSTDNSPPTATMSPSPYSRRSSSPPPPLPSPQLLPTPLPSPPTFSARLPRRRLHILSQPSSPAPIPPRLIGSPLLNKTLNTSRSYERIDEKAKATLWVDGDEFGSNRSESDRIKGKDKEQRNPYASPSFPPNKRATRRPSPIHIIYHSPPPSPSITSPPPPVPPIPAFLLSHEHKKPILHTPPMPSWPAKIIPCQPERYSITLRRKRGLSAPHHYGRAAGLTCSQFMAMRNEPRRVGRITTV